MKKLIYCAAALAAMIFAGSCQQENLEPVAQESTVTFSVEIPGVQTKAIGDGFNVDQLVYEVWKTEGANVRDLKDVTKATRLYQETTKLERIDDEQKTIITLNLVHDQNYTILFWAQNSQAVDVDGKKVPAYVTDDLTNVHYAKEVTAEKSYLSNNENMAAFYKAEFLTAEEIERPNGIRRTELKRPFAQLNIGTKNTAEEYVVTMNDSKVKISNVPTTFNVAQNVAANSKTGTAASPAVDKPSAFVFDYATVPDKTESLWVNGDEYEYVAMNYIFANGNVEVEYWIDATLTATDPTAGRNETTNAIIYNKVPQVPLMENYRTNIVGNLLTSTTKYEVVIDADFETPEYVRGDEWSQNGNYNYTINANASEGTLKAVLEHANAEAKAEATKAEGPVVTINLAGDVVWETGAGIGSTPLLPVDSPISAVLINGNGKTFTATGDGVGKIRLANGGKLTFKKVKIVDQSVSYAENSWEYGYLELGGVIRLEDCEVVNAIMVSGETAAFKNCSFNSGKDNEYDVWVDEGSAYFTECTFAGARGLKIHEAYGSEVVKVAVDRCTFGPLSEKPGVAMGDLNEETSVSIINSTFDSCQAGDQNNYAYETDTDITDFEFTFTNNIVIPSGDGFIKQEDGITYIVANATGLKNAIADSKDGDIIKLNSGKYDDLFQVGGKSITITSLKENSQAVVAGRVSVAGNANSTATFTNLKFEVSDNTHAAFGNTYYDKGQDYIIGIYCGNVTVQNCEFAGMTDVFGAITFHNYASGATTETLEKLVVDGCKFDGGRAIRARSNVSVTNCKFSGLVNPCLQVLGLGADGIDSEVVFTGNESDVAVSGVCIKTSNFSTKNITFNVSGNTNCNTISFDEKNVNNLYPDTYKYTGEVNGLTPEGSKGLAKMLSNDKINVINLAAGAEYDLTEIQYIKHAVTLNGDKTNKPVVKGKLVAENTFEANNVKFAANDVTSQVYTGAGTYEKKNYVGIVHLRYAEGTFNGCEFDRNGCGINYFNDASDKLLKINMCTFTNGCFIYTKALCEVTNSSFDTSVPLYIWPRDTNGHPEWTSQCTFIGNNVSYTNGFAVALLSQSCPYRNIVFNVQDNEGTFGNIYAAANNVMNKPETGVANDGSVTFAEGSKKFKINENGTFGGDINE